MSNIVRGLYAGFLASLIVAALYFVDYGPGNDYYGVANWFALGTRDTGKFYGFLIIVVLGLLFGLIFGLIQGRKQITIGRAIATGMALGLVCWVIFALLVANFAGRASISHLTLSSFLYPFVLCLVYGLLLGTIYFQSTVRRVIKAK
ncbi:MAG: hypothetical protein ABI406_20845 [Ktedonobacteraceae bacterium]